MYTYKDFQAIYKLCIKWENQQIIEEKAYKMKKKKKRKKNDKFPGSGSPSRLGPLSRYNALPTELRGTCHDWRVNFKITSNKNNTYCKVQVGKDSMEKVFCL